MRWPKAPDYSIIGRKRRPAHGGFAFSWPHADKRGPMPSDRPGYRSAGAYPQPPIPPDDDLRVKTLEGYNVLDTDPEQDYDDLTLLASEICGTPIALVSLIDTDRQWFKSRIGLNVPQTPRDVAFCAHAIAGAETLIVEDATEDERFAKNPLVLGDPNIRFYAGAPLVVPEGQALGTLCVIDRVPRHLTARQQKALEALSRQVVAQLELRRTVEELQSFAIRDPLTGLFNRRYFDSALPMELERSKRYEDPVSLLLVDADRFKTINDTHGHQEGDRVLMLISKILTMNLRASDVVCRFGGEEFAVVLPHTSIDVAAQLAERVRAGIAEGTEQVNPPLAGGPVTVTIGVAACPKEANDATQLIAVADRRLYAGKMHGRDRVVAFDG